MASSSAAPTNTPAAQFALLPSLPAELREIIWRTGHPRFHITIDVKLNTDGADTVDRKDDRRPADVEIELDHEYSADEDDYLVSYTKVKDTVKLPLEGFAIVKHFTFWNFLQGKGPNIKPVRFSVDTSTGLAIGTFPYHTADETDLRTMLGFMNMNLVGGLGSVKELRLFEKLWNGKPWRLDLDDESSYDTSLGYILESFTGLTHLLFMVPNGISYESMYRVQEPSQCLWKTPRSHGWKVCQEAARDHFDEIEVATGIIAPRVIILLGRKFSDANIIQEIDDAQNEEFQWNRSDRRNRGPWVEHNFELDPNRSRYPDHIQRFFQANPSTRVFGQNN